MDTRSTPCLQPPRLLPLSHTAGLPRNGRPRGRCSLARLCTQGPRRGPALSRRQDRRGQRWRWEDRSFQGHPVRPQPRGDVPRRGRTSHWLLPPSAAGGSSGRMGLREGGRLAWQGAAMLRHTGKGAARRGLGEPGSCATATEQAGMS